MNGNKKSITYFSVLCKIQARFFISILLFSTYNEYFSQPHRHLHWGLITRSVQYIVVIIDVHHLQMWSKKYFVLFLSVSSASSLLCSLKSKVENKYVGQYLEDIYQTEINN